MANRERGELTMLAGERTYTLRWTTNACCELEDFAGRTWDSVFAGVNRGSFKDMRLMFWVALRDHHPDLATLDPACLSAIGIVIDEAGGINRIHAGLRALALINADETAPGTAGARPPGAQAGPTGDNSTLTH